MTTVALVGEVPNAVTEAVTTKILAAGGKVRAVALGSSPDRELRGVDLVVLHVPLATPAAGIATWQDAAYEGQQRVALTIEGALDSRAGMLLFHPGVFPLVPLNDGDLANEASVDLFLQHVVTPDPIQHDDIAIGRFFKPGTNATEYRTQRFLSLASMSMHDFLFDLRSAVDAMSTPISQAGDLPPWDPDDGQPSAITSAKNQEVLRAAGLHNLSELFTLPKDPVSVQTLQADPTSRQQAERAWDPPKLLVRGESGSGKSLVADLVHMLLKERARMPRMPFVTVNCAALTAKNLDYQLFGAAPNVYSDITRPVVGDLAKAAYGVAFLDEVGDLELSAQKRFLVILGSGLIRPAGISPYPSYLRFVAATNRDIPHLIDQQRFRNDLNERFEKRVEIPPLRDRDPAELEWLIDFVAINPGRNPAGAVSHIDPAALRALLAHEYRNGNFRELEAVVHDGIARARRRGSACLRARDLSFAEVRTIADTEARIIEVATVDLARRAHVHVKDMRALHRVAELVGAPILRDDNGTLVVVTAGQVYSHP